MISESCLRDMNTIKIHIPKNVSDFVLHMLYNQVYNIKAFVPGPVYTLNIPT